MSLLIPLQFPAHGADSGCPWTPASCILPVLMPLPPLTGEQHARPALVVVDAGAVMSVVGTAGQ